MKIISLLKKYWPIVLVLFIGSFFRLYGLLQNPISLYSDEVDIGYQVQSLLKTGCDYTGVCIPIQFHSFSDTRTPLPIYFTALIHLVGVPLDYAIRFSSALFGILGILATYFFLENLNSKKIFNLDLSGLGILGAIILSLIPWHLTYSRIGFELSALYFFVIFGLYLYTQYQIEAKNKYLYLSALFLGLTPMVYSTAKMAVLAFPLVILILSGLNLKNFRNIKTIYFLLILTLPFLILLINGGAASRFQYISVFTDPTASTEVSYQRRLDAGPAAQVGTAPSLITNLFHNKPLWYGNNVINNAFNLISTDFLFINGDPNLRHSPANWGMLYKSLFPLLIVGIYYLVRNRNERLLFVLLIIAGIAVSTSSITRDGGSHASRSFLMIVPLVILSAIGLSYLNKIQKFIFYIASFFVIIESVFFIHDYWFHYRFASERDWNAGMKDLINSTKKYPSQSIVISSKYENPLIFYLYYTQFDPKKFQRYVKSNTVYNSISSAYNFNGNRIGDSNFYIGSLSDENGNYKNTIPNSVYYLTRAEVEKTNVSSSASISAIIKLPTGDPLFYEVHF